MVYQADCSTAVDVAFDLAADCILVVAAADTIWVVTLVAIQVVAKCLWMTDVDAAVDEFAVSFRESSADVADATWVADAMLPLSKPADQLAVTHVVEVAAEACSLADFYLDLGAVVADVIQVADVMFQHLVQHQLLVQPQFQAADATTHRTADVA